ncbi:MAG: hypothetical protein RDV41_04860 [Planctomycetota bacterium]|nr:hypothetical protein [Planctomycetota bacterium]
MLKTTGTTLTANSALTVAGTITVTDGIMDIAGYAVNVTGATTIAAGKELKIGSGTYTAGGAFTASGAATTFTGAGKLKLASAGDTPNLGTLTPSTGTVEYLGAGQTVHATTYNHLTISTSTTATLGASAGVGGNLSVAAGTLSVTGGTLTVSGATDVAAALSIGAATVNAAGSFACTGAVSFTDAGTLRLGGTISSFSWLTTFAGSTVEYYCSTGAVTVYAFTYRNLLINVGAQTASSNGVIATADSGNVTVQAGTLSLGTNNLAVAGNLTVAAGKTLTFSTALVDVTGTFNATGANVNITGAGTLELSGPVTGLGTFSAASGSTVKYNAAADQDIDDVTYHHLTIDKGASAGNCTGSFLINGNCTITSGTFAVGAWSVNTSSSTTTSVTGTLSIGSGTYDANGPFNAAGGSTITFGAGGTGFLKFGSSVTIGAITFVPGNSTIVYDDASNPQTVQTLAYFNLQIVKDTQTASTAAPLALGGSLTVTSGILALGANNIGIGGGLTNAGSITAATALIDVGGTFDSTGGLTFTGAGTLRLAGTVSNFASFTAGSSLVKYVSSSDQSVKALTYYDLEIDKAAGLAVAAGSFATSRNLTVTAGTFQVGANTITVAGATSVTASGAVSGVLDIGVGTLDANGAFSVAGVGGTAAVLQFSGSGRLQLGSGSPVFTAPYTFTAGTGTVAYDDTAAAQDVVALSSNYNNIEISKASTTGSTTGEITLTGNLNVISGTLFVGANGLNVGGSATVAGTLETTTATIDCNGTFNATGGNVKFTGAGTGQLRLGGALTSLGTFTAGSSTVVYDSTTTDQTVAGVTYFDLKFSNTGRTATLSTTATVNNNLTVDTQGTLALVAGSGMTLTAAGGTVTVESGAGTATLTLTGSCTLQVAGSIAMNSGGRFVSTQFGGIRPTVTWYNNDRYSFRVNNGGRIDVNDMTMSYVDGDGLCVMPGATIDGIDNLYLTDNTGVTPVTWAYSTALNIRLGASASVDYSFANVRFYGGPTYTVTTDAAYTASRVVELSQPVGGGSATENDREAGQQEGAGHSIVWLMICAWNGTISSDWGDGDNWSPTGIPDANYDVSIVTAPNPCYVATGTTRACRSFSLQSGAFEVQGTGILEVNKDFTRTGGTFGGTGTTKFVGDVAQNVSPTGMTFAQVEVNKGAESVSLGAAMNVSGNVTVTAGTLAVGGSSLTVQGTLSGAGNITISTGTVTVQAGGDIDLAGTTTFSGAGELRIRAASVTSLGVLAGASGWVVYDSTTVDQTVCSMTYPTNLRINRTGLPSPPTASLAGVTTVDGQLSVAAGTLSLAGQTLTCNGNVTVPVGAILSLTDASTMYIADGKIVTVNGKLYAQGTAPKPTITHTGAGSDRFSLVVNGQVEVDGLNFSWATQNGLEIASTTTITTLRNIRFENAPSGAGNRHLSITRSALSLVCDGCFFDDSFLAGGKNVYLNDSDGGNNVIVTLEDKVDGSSGPGAGSDYEWEVNTAAINWVNDVGTPLSGAVQGYPTAAYTLGAGSAFWAIYAATRNVGGPGTDDRLYVLDGSGTAQYFYTVPDGNGDIVGTPWWDDEAPGAGGGQVVYFGTTKGLLYKLLDDGAGLAVAPGYPKAIGEDADPDNDEVTSAVVSDFDSGTTTGPNVYFGAIKDGVNGIMAYDIAGGTQEFFIGTDPYPVRTAPMWYKSLGIVYLFLGSDSVGGQACVYRVDTSTTIENIDAMGAYPTTGHFRGDIQIAPGAWTPGNGYKPTLFIGNTDGKVYGLNCFAYGSVADLQHLNPSGTTWSPKFDNPAGGVWALVWYGIAYPYLYYGDDTGRVHVFSQVNGAGLGAPFPLQVDGGTAIKAGMQAWWDKNGNGHVIYVGNSGGKYMVIDERDNSNNPLGTVISTMDFGDVEITTISCVYFGGPNPYKMMIGTSDGSVYLVDEAIDPTPSY